MRLRLVPSILALAAAALLASGCTAAPVPAPTASTVSPTPKVYGAYDVVPLWIDGGRRIAIVTWGSSWPICQPRVDSPVAKGQLIEVWMGVPADAADMMAPCPDDLVPSALTFGVPDGVDVTREVHVLAHHRGSELRLRLP